MDSQNLRRILIIVINYKSEEDLYLLIEDIKKLTLEKGQHLSLLIVDNSKSFPSTPDLVNVKQDGLNIDVYSPEENLGYFGAAQAALDRYLKSHSTPEFVIVSNADIRITDNLFASKLYETTIPSLSSEENVGLVAPSILSFRTSRDQNPFMISRPPPWVAPFYRRVFSSYIFAILYHYLYLIKTLLKSCLSIVGNEDTQREIYAAHGSFIILPQRYFKLGGTLKHGAFLFGEEIYLAESLRRLALKAVYKPRLKVEHREHVATGIFPSRRNIAFQHEAWSYLEKEFFSP